MELMVSVVNVAAGVEEDAEVYNLTVLPALPADHQKPKYLAGVVNVSVRSCPTGAITNRVGVPLTVGVSVAVVAPPQMYDGSLDVHVPVNVPTALAGKDAHVLHELKVSIGVPYELGGP